MTNEDPARFPPPLLQTTTREDGTRVPVMQAPFIECGEVVRLGDQLAVCTRRKGHPLFLDYAHSNGYSQWIDCTPVSA